tara:strand:+ start:303 stop:725 length:423 start_codon:yes stop_codon:yes gene_type:complete
MREKFEIDKIGEVYLKPPRSFITIHDVITEYRNNSTNFARLSRINAALLGVCWDHEKNKKHPPIYDVSEANVIAYGGQMLEWLIVRKVNLPKFFSEFGPVFTEVWGLMPKEDEVAKAADNFPDEGESGSAGDEDRASMGE